MNILLLIAGLGCLSCFAGCIVLAEKKKHMDSMEITEVYILGKDANPLRLLYWLIVFTAAIPFIFVYGGVIRCFRPRKT
jgi:hypothetical protein